MYKASAAIKKLGKRETLILQDKNGTTANITECANILTEHFSKQLYCEFADTLQEVPPTDMNVPFSSEEIRKALFSMKNNKSAGIDEIKLELLKYGCDEILERISVKIVARTGNFPIEITQGLLVPIQKRNKKRGPPVFTNQNLISVDSFGLQP